MKPLKLTLKKKWYDMILSGEKTEEYRDIKMYWASRLMGGFPSTFGINMVNPDFKNFSYVQFTNGYRADSRTMLREVYSISIGEGRPEWGAEVGKKYFIIKLRHE